MILEAYPPPEVMHDRRKFAAQIHGSYACFPRKWEQLDMIVLHQTACDMGERVERYDTMGAHFGGLRSGAVTRLHDLNKVLAAANGFNKRSVSIEVNGLFSGTLAGKVWDNPKTAVHEQAMNVTMAQVTSMCALIPWIVSEAAKNGATIKYLCAHRQSSKDRRDDPGEQPWKLIALPMMKLLGLTAGPPGYKVGDGYAIPRDWDSASKEPY